MPNPTQDNRIAQLRVPTLGHDQLVLSSFNVSEELSRPFDIRIECLSVDENIDFNPALGLEAHIKMTTVGKATRYFSGILVEAGWFGERESLYAYHLVLRPWLWLLTQTADCRIFQNKSVLDIITDVFSRAGFHDFEFKNSESYKALEYCVQYRETHFEFVSRLMESYGLYYFFRHEEGKHTLVICDGKSSHKRIEALKKVSFASQGERTRDTEEYLTTWLSGRQFQTGKVTVNAYDFNKPTADLKHEEVNSGGYAHGEMEVYDYPEKYKVGEQPDFGAKHALARLYSVQGQDRRRQASGDAPSLYPGGLTKLEKFATASENIEYLVIAASHSYVGQAYTSGGGGGTGDSYHGNYVFQPSGRTYKAPLVTRRPIVHGPQTALVVGPSGEEIYCDKHGRIAVQFHWDREGRKDQNSSRWVRVSQIWAGKQWGGIVIPRIGMEVVVEFIEGDPDRPLVTGTVYNTDNQPPFALPDNKTQSGVRTRSTKGGGESNYNELVYEDKKGSEFVRFHAEKDLNSTIENAETRIVKGAKGSGEGGATRDTKIEGGDDVLEISRDNKITIHRDQTVKIDHDQTVKIDHDQNVTIDNNQTIKVGSTISVTANAKIEFICGPSKITMTPTYIEITSNMIKIAASGMLMETGNPIMLN